MTDNGTQKRLAVSPKDFVDILIFALLLDVFWTSQKKFFFRRAPLLCDKAFAAQ